jgi:predicted phage terminase large subunit-like protein
VQLTPKQLQAQAILSGPATHCMLFGGSRSGKTFLHVRNIIMRALKAPGSRHGIFRFRALHVHESIVLDTFPKAMKLAFPAIRYTLHKGDGYASIHTGTEDSEIWFSGLDDKERVEKVLGKEFATLYFNECSQIPMSSVDTAMTRLAQLVQQQIKGRDAGPLKPRAYYDCNPPSKAHWTYKRFIEKRDPETNRPMPNGDDYASFQINPGDNAQNLSGNYLATLQGMSARLQKRFLKGEFADATPNQLFPSDHIDKWRVKGGELPDMVRIVVGVDPSGSGDVDNADNDAIGICVGGLGTDGNAYLIEDLTVKAGPGTWGRLAVSAWERHQADCIVGETNYGGAMVGHTIATAAKEAGVRPSYRTVTASRGKVVRAEPFSALYEQGKVRHVGEYFELEDELTAFSTYGYLGDKSPNRADAWIWVLASLFPALVKSKAAEEKKTAPPQRFVDHGWMG